MATTVATQPNDAAMVAYPSAMSAIPNQNVAANRRLLREKVRPEVSPEIDVLRGGEGGPHTAALEAPGVLDWMVSLEVATGF
jgi:hypothetical protein